MQIKLKKHASRVEEAIDLCKLMTRQYHFDEAKKRLLDKYQFEVFDVEKMMKQRSIIEKDFLNTFKDKEEILDHYFKQRSANIFLSDLLMKLPYMQTEKRKCRYVYDEELNRSKAFVDAFYEMDLIDETYTQNVSNFEELSLLLEKIDMDREDKWLIQTTYLHIAEEMKYFVSFINQVVDWLGKYEEQICKEEEAFYEYWNHINKSKRMDEYFSQQHNINISKKTNVMWMVPAYFNCTGIYAKTKKDVIYVYIGMVLDETFSFEKKYETPELICSQLKLLSDPSKFDILCTIKERSYYGSELAKKFNLSTPTISHHMRTLENAGFIKIEKKDNKTYYSLDHERLGLFLNLVESRLLKGDD